MKLKCGAGGTLVVKNQNPSLISIHLYKKNRKQKYTHTHTHTCIELHRFTKAVQMEKLK